MRPYYQLTKPGIIRGNAITALAGFLLAAQGSVAINRLLAMLFGLSAIIASACIANNYIDRDIDQHMARTSHRALVTGIVLARRAVILAAILGLGGVVVLVAFTTVLTALLAVSGFIAYVWLYTTAKRLTVHGTVIGSLSGAIPPLVGFSAVGGRLDLAAVILFLIVVFWQMPHFYAIAIFRLEEYKSAKIPVLPARSGIRATKYQLIAYVVAFAVAIISLWIAGFGGLVYIVPSGAVTVYWLWRAVRGFGIHDTRLDIRWARQMFGISLLVISVVCLAIGVDSFI